MKKLLFLPAAAAILLTLCALPAPGNKTALDAYTRKTLPAQEKLTEFRLAVAEAQLNLSLWIQAPGEAPFKAELWAFTESRHPVLRSELLRFAADTAFPAAVDMKRIMAISDTLVGMYKDIMSSLSTIEDYNNPEVVFLAKPRVLDHDGDCRLMYRFLKNDLLDADLRLREQGKMQLREVRGQ